MSDELARHTVDKLGPAAKQALTRAIALAHRKRQAWVEPIHLLRCALDMPAGDLLDICRGCGLAPSAVGRELDAGIDAIPEHPREIPTFSVELLELLRRAWVLASLSHGESTIRVARVLEACFEDAGAGGPTTALRHWSPTLATIPRARWRGGFAELLGPLEPVIGSAPPTRDRTEAAALDRYTADLTAQARAGELDPIVGRDDEIRQLVDVLCRRRQNNPILTGEPGVGKTAIVEGLANAIVEGEVPPSLAEVSVRVLDLGLLQAGAGVRGEFEARLRDVVNAVVNADKPIILFVDEAHTLIGSGGQAGLGDAANLLKPALARGELRMIAATTWTEYKRHIEKDPALARRFQIVRVAEPDLATCERMLRRIAPRLAAHHGVRILDEGLRAAVALAQRYLPERRLPDGAVATLDTACARVAIAQSSPPAAVRDAAARVQALDDEIAALEAEAARSEGDEPRLPSLREAAREAERGLNHLEAAWTEQRNIARRILDLEAKIAEALARDPEAEVTGWQHALRRNLDRLASITAEQRLVPTQVDAAEVAAVIASWTGIPVGRIAETEAAGVLALHQRLRERIVGQDHALDAVARRVRTARAQLDDPRKPVGVFLFVGPSGVGKTKTAAVLAELLFGDRRSLIVVNMSEYQEPHSVAGLRGAPPGYVGYGRGGVLTEAVRQRPYAVVLLDEIEKAHRDVAQLFFQVFDKGVLEDGEGIAVDFSNTLVILTSNLGAELLDPGCDPAAAAAALEPVLAAQFSAAWLARMVVVPFLPLAQRELEAIVELEVAAVVERFVSTHGVALELDPQIIRRALDADASRGARQIDAVLTHEVLPALSSAILERVAAGRELVGLRCRIAPDGSIVAEALDAVTDQERPR